MTKGPHDPTRAGTVAAPTSAATVRLSRNEIETLCMKAARGAGMEWGSAEEAGFAAGWLAGHGMDGAGALLFYLEAGEGRDRSARRPRLGSWHTSGGDDLCPIALGIALSDHADLPNGPLAKGGVKTGPVACPILVLPFLALLAGSRGGAMSLRWPEGHLGVSVDRIWPREEVLRLAGCPSASLEISRSDAPAAGSASPGLGAVSAETIARLNTLAMRTTVPASAVSRQGAGAVADDND